MNQARPLIKPVILSGGSGTRLWPLSRQHHPKQLLSLGGDATLLQETIARLSALNAAGPLVICNAAHRFMVAEQLQQTASKPEGIILEPVGRNTAPAIAIAALLQKEPADILLILPADHSIKNAAAFCRGINQGAALAEQGDMVTFGIMPDAPATAYGYIKAGPSKTKDAFHAERFAEKPDQETATAYLLAGNYYWNSGIFMFRADRYIEALERYAPKMLIACREALHKAEIDRDFTRLDRAAFEKCPSNSIDYAVLEKTRNLVVIPIDMGWNDLGSWSSLWESSEKDAAGNRLVGDVLTENAHNNFVHSKERLVSIVGLDNAVVVDTADALLVADKSQVQDVKLIVQQLNALQRPEAKLHRKVTRPWGSYDTVDADEGFKVKRITVNPGASLSLQKHHHRAEHWVVVSGSAEVTRGQDVFRMHKNESTYIPIGEVHRLRNPGKTPLKLIEVQSGDYLGEDDIVRLDDVYHRN